MSNPTASQFHDSVRNGDIDGIRNLLSSEEHLVNTPHGCKNITPLHVAVKEARRDVVNVLLEHGARCDIPNYRGTTPLHLAAREGLADILAEFVNMSNIRPNIRHVRPNLDTWNNQRRTALHLASKNSIYDCVGILIEAGADVNAQDRLNKTPLHFAAENVSLSVVRLLLDADADPTIEAKTPSQSHPSKENGTTPLHYAVAVHKDAYQNIEIPAMMIDKLTKEQCHKHIIGYLQYAIELGCQVTRPRNLVTIILTAIKKHHMKPVFQVSLPNFNKYMEDNDVKKENLPEEVRDLLE